jgi:shikimate kinase
VSGSKLHVALIGPMGAGKSTIGRRLARALGCAFADTDELIVDEARSSIPEIFAAEGEAGFRKRELEAVQRAFAGAPSVVALGGGAVTHRATRELVASSAVRVYLEVEARLVLARLRRSPSVRPLVGPAPTMERVRAILTEREPYYREAEVTVVGGGASAGIIRVIVERLAEHGFAQSGVAARTTAT